MFGLALQTSNFAALLTFLETQGTVHVLSSPRVATLNNQKAVLKVGTDDFFVTNVSDHGGHQRQRGHDDADDHRASRFSPASRST